MSQLWWLCNWGEQNSQQFWMQIRQKHKSARLCEALCVQNEAAVTENHIRSQRYVFLTHTHQ